MHNRKLIKRVDKKEKKNKESISYWLTRQIPLASVTPRSIEREMQLKYEEVFGLDKKE